MKYRVEWFGGIFAVVGIAMAVAPARAQEPLLWGGLRPGPHAVGYRMLYEFDHAREYDPEYEADAMQPPAHRPRPIPICLWYPAKKTNAPPMEYRQYLDMSSEDPRVTEFSRRLNHQFRKVVCEETVGAEPTGLAPAEAAAFSRLLATKTIAVKDASAADGQFPVVIYHPGLGGTPDDNSAMFEYLASHGYVVLSSSFHAADGSSVACGGDLTSTLRDVEFLCRYARLLPFADADRLAAMGHSYGAWAMFAWAAEPCSPLRAFITLDSGLEYTTVESSGADSLVRHMKLNKDNIRAASLRFASRERDAHFDYLDSYLKFTPRYEATVASLTHNDYLTHGAVRPALLPEKWPDAQNARRTSYDRVCEHVFYFLDAVLKQKSAARQTLDRGVHGDGRDDRFQLRFHSPARAAPTNRQIAQYVKKHGAEKAAALVRSFPEFPRGKLAVAPFLLLQEGDARTSLAVLSLVEKDCPNDAGIQAMLGQARALLGDRKGAAAAFRKAAELLPGDQTVGGLRPYWKLVIERGLKETGESESLPKKR